MTPATVTALLFAAVLCSTALAAPAPHAITGEGVGPVRIGMSAKALAQVVRVVSDREEADGEGGLRRVVRTAVRGGAVAAEIVDGRVWRIEVVGRGLSTAPGIAVGTPLARVLALPGLGAGVGEGALYAWSSALCGRSFQLSHDLDPAQDLPRDGQGPDLTRLPKSVQVQTILVFGCRRPETETPAR